jgi:hypothetical protein
MSVIKYCVCFGLIGVVGAVAFASGNPTLLVVYTGCVSLAALTVSIGGFLAYMSQEQVDKREIRGEYRAHDRAEISRLAEKNIQLEKELYAATRKSAETEQHNATCIIGGGLGSD